MWIVYVYSKVDFFALQVEGLVRCHFDFDWTGTITGVSNVVKFVDYGAYY
jgi:hypothetical protein